MKNIKKDNKMKQASTKPGGLLLLLGLALLLAAVRTPGVVKLC